MSLLRKIIAGVGDLTVDAWGIQKVSLPFSLFHSTFTYDIPRGWFLFEDGVQVQSSTEITSVAGEAVITSSATNTDCRLESRQCLRYQPNRGTLFSTALHCPLATADGTREWGLGTTENQVLFRLKADGLLYAVLRSGNVEVLEELIDTSVLGDFDVQLGNTYDIQLQWRGSGDYLFYIGNPATGKCKLVHQFKLLGTLTSVSIQNPTMIRAIRGTADPVIHIGCVDVTSENGGQLTADYTTSYAEGVAVSGLNSPVMVIHVTDLIASLINTRTIRALKIGVKSDKKGNFKAWVTRDPTAIVGATFTAIGNGSFTETDSPDINPASVRATSVDIAKLRFVMAVDVEANVRQSTFLQADSAVKLIAVRGDFVVITNSPTGAGSSNATLEWGEEV